MDVLYGWYSLNAFNDGEKEYIYTNEDNQETFCTVVSYENVCPYKQKRYEDVVYLGKLKYFIKEQQKGL